MSAIGVSGPGGGEGQGAAPAEGEPLGHILLVDDEPSIARGYARLLTLAGYRVETANDGKEAAERTKVFSYDAIVSDITMPEMSGLAFLRSVREHDLDVPVILMTGGPAIESAMQALEHGAPAAARRTSNRPVRPTARDNVYREMTVTLTKEYRFEAAERLGRLRELGRMIRDRVASKASELPLPGLLFVNVHAMELEDDSLYAASGALSPHASRVILEITERAPLERINDVSGRVAQLRAMGYRIAVDDLGAGYAGLTSFAQLEPEVVKVDMSLIRGLDRSLTKQKLVHSIVGLCRGLGIQMIAEGIETEEERDTLVNLGGDLCQGYLFARPGRAFPSAVLRPPSSDAR